MSTPAIAVERVLAPSDEARRLIDELDAELLEGYEPEQHHGLTFDAIFQPTVRFFVARIDACAAGCGGVALFPAFAEVKRMYVRPAFRGSGVVDAIIDRLTAEARTAGLRLVRLETGTLQIAAVRFYERHGFHRCSAFEPYDSMTPHAIATSIFMEKIL